MTLDKFLKFKREVEEGLQRAIDLYEKTGVLRDCISKEKVKYVGLPELYEEHTKGETRYSIADHQRLIKQGYTVDVKASTYVLGRHDYIDYIYLMGLKKVIITTEDEFKSRVKERMHIILRRYISKDLGRTFHGSIDCAVMELFKEGEITWKQVVKIHSGECSM